MAEAALEAQATSFLAEVAVLVVIAPTEAVKTQVAERQLKAHLHLWHQPITQSLLVVAAAEKQPTEAQAAPAPQPVSRLFPQAVEVAAAVSTERPTQHPVTADQAAVDHSQAPQAQEQPTKVMEADQIQVQFVAVAEAEPQLSEPRREPAPMVQLAAQVLHQQSPAHQPNARAEADQARTRRAQAEPQQAAAAPAA